MSPYLSIVTPLYNEEKTVEKLLSGILEVGRQFDFEYEIIFIDDGSTDNTWEIIEQLQKTVPVLRAIKFRRNYGQTSAMVAGFDHAAGQFIITLDGDLQNDPSDIPMLMQKLEEGYDVVSGWRKNRKDHISRVIPSKVANGIISLITGVHLHDYGCSLKAYRTECIKTLKAYGEMHRFFPALASMTGARLAEKPVQHHPRQYGVSKYGFGRIPRVFTDIFAMNAIIRFSSTPLKGFAFWAIPFLLSSMLFGVLSLLALIIPWTPGKALFFSIAAALNLMAFVHLIALGVLGELVVGASDLSHTQMPEITKKHITVEIMEEGPLSNEILGNHSAGGVATGLSPIRSRP
jgi:glycosyltransferase involved in cell wall biosynthesis